MFGIRRLTIAQHERALVFRNKRFSVLLEPGVYWRFDPLSRTVVQVFDLAAAEFAHPRADFLVTEARAAMERHFVIAELSDREAGVVYRGGRVAGIIAPGSRKLFWRAPTEVRIDKYDLGGELELPAALARVLSGASGALAVQAAEAVSMVDVPDTAFGLLIVDGEFVRVLEPGAHAFWKFQRATKVELVERRIQAMEIQGQEILTRDKVSLRINLTALWQVQDAVQARSAVTNIADAVYKELQFALRSTVGGRTLDELLGDKGALDREIGAIVVERLVGLGIVVKSVGVKDVILPGEMKTILNQVVEAEKRAQANLIQRREETAATRSLLNTARLMDENPTLLRLKELESLEKVTEKIDKLTVFGGLEGVLRDVVRIKASDS
jgi:regulator of protease activity HflC (stomatin/prohibitin superfamily)